MGSGTIDDGKLSHLFEAKFLIQYMNLYAYMHGFVERENVDNDL